MNQGLFIIVFMVVTPFYSSCGSAVDVPSTVSSPSYWAYLKNMLPGVPPNMFTLLKDPDYLLKSGHATTARLVGGLQSIANMKSKDLMYGRTSMHFAAESGSEGTVKNLLNAGYSFNIQDNYGNLPLHSAAASGKGGAVKALIHSGADPLIRNNRGDTPLVYAVLSCNIDGVDALLNSLNNQKEIKDLFMKTPGIAKLTPLQQAIYGCSSLVEILLKHGANPNYVVPYSENPSPLLIAASLGIDKIVDMLLKYGADVMIVDTTGQTALHKAAIARHSSIVEKLLLKGGQSLMDMKDRSGKTALDYTESGSGLRLWMTRWKLGKWY